MISPKGIISRDHYLISVKDHGDLLYSPEDVLKILKSFEVVFKTVVSGKDFQDPKIMQKSKLNLKLRNMVLRPLPQRLFGGIPCDSNNEIVTENLHSYQLIKEIIDKFMKIRHLRYGQHFTELTMKRGKCRIRQKLGYGYG